MPLGVPKAGDVPGKQALAGRSSPTACAGRGERSSPGGMASRWWMRACRIPPCEAHLGYSNGAQLHWVQELKTTGALRGACGRREWCTLRWGRLPVPAKGGWSGWTWCWRLATSAAFEWHPSQTVLGSDCRHLPSWLCRLGRSRWQPTVHGSWTVRFIYGSRFMTVLLMAGSNVRTSTVEK